MAIKIRKCFVTIAPEAPFSWSRYLQEKPEPNKHEEFEGAFWRSKAHIVEDVVQIPQMSMKFALCDAAKYTGKRIPGGGQKTYTKLFESALQPLSKYASTGVQAEQLKPEWLFVPADGKAGSGRRVSRCFPILEPSPEWSATFKFMVSDDRIEEKVMLEHIEVAGIFIGLGRWRVQNKGCNGSFRLVDLKWETVG